MTCRCFIKAPCCINSRPWLSIHCLSTWRSLHFPKCLVDTCSALMFKTHFKKSTHSPVASPHHINQTHLPAHFFPPSYTFFLCNHLLFLFAVKSQTLPISGAMWRRHTERGAALMACTHCAGGNISPSQRRQLIMSGKNTRRAAGVTSFPLIKWKNENYSGCISGCKIKNDLPSIESKQTVKKHHDVLLRPLRFCLT